MTKNKKFVLDSIKMDLFRVVTATGDITKEIPTKSVETFLKHADKDFDKITLNKSEQKIRSNIRALARELYNLEDPKTRLRWAEDIMTARCML